MSDFSQAQSLGVGTQKVPLASNTLLATPEERSTEFVAVNGPEGETTSATVMLVTAYALFWVILLAFVWLTWRRQMQLTQRLQVIESQLANPKARDKK